MSETLLDGPTPATADTGPEVTPFGEGRTVREDCWREVHRLFHVERRSKSEIARQLQLDRKTVRGILDEAAWQPYTRDDDDFLQGLRGSGGDEGVVDELPGRARKPF